MDDAWLHHLTATPTAHREKPLHKRRVTLLQQSAGRKADEATEAIDEVSEDDEPWALSRATPARRAQSYSDFYRVASAFAVKELERDSHRTREIAREDYVGANRELAFDEDCAATADDLVNASHWKYQTHQEHLELSNSHLEILLASTQDTLAILSALTDSFKAVASQTEEFRKQCTTLVDETRRLESLANAVDDNARYYTFLEPMTRRLNAPGAVNLVKGKDFPEMLSNLDNCLAYMEAHPTHKESAMYRSRYRLLLTRALTLIRHHFTKSLGDIAADISKRIQGGQLKETTHSALLYAKFRVSAPELKLLGLEIQKRAVLTPDDVEAGREPEYMSLLNELYQSYSATRGRLILPLVSRKMAELASTSQQGDVLAFARSSIAFVRGICLDEYELWFEWFETEGALYSFLESLMDPVSDYLRPRMIHETSLEKLCELCAMIQGRFMESDSEQEDDTASAIASPLGENPAGRSLNFSHLIQPALQDAQTRLVFLALNALRDSIETFKPKPEDLDFPRKATSAGTPGVKNGPILSGKRERHPAESPAAKTSGVTPAETEGVDDGGSVISKQLVADSAAKQGSHQWYPTLHKAIWLLRRIYRLVNSTVFDDLAHRIVHSTIASLLHAGHLVTTKKSAQDGQLFLITHFLHLKQQIVAFDIEFIPPEVEFDFSSVTNPFYELRDRGSLWNPASWVRLVSGAVGGGLLPKVVENMLDAKAELDGRIRTVINDFVNGYAVHITAPLDAAPASTPPDSKPKPVAERPFDAVKALRTVRGLAEKDVPAMRAKLLDFIDDARTRETLVSAVRDQVVLRYEEFFDAMSEGHGRKLSRKGKGREDEVWGPDMFGEAMEKVFHVAQFVGDGNSGRNGEVSD